MGFKYQGDLCGDILEFLRRDGDWHVPSEILSVTRAQGYDGRGPAGIFSPLRKLERQGLVETRFKIPDPTFRYPKRGRGQRPTGCLEYRATRQEA